MHGNLAQYGGPPDQAYWVPGKGQSCTYIASNSAGAQNDEVHRVVSRLKTVKLLKL